MRWILGLRLGALRKGALATAVLVLALTGVVWVSVAATRGATSGADRIEQEFAERVSTDRVSLLLVENAGLVAQRISPRDGAVAFKLDDMLVRTSSRLSSAIGPALDGGNGVRGREADAVAGVRKAFPRYIEVRERLLRHASNPDGQSDAALDSRLVRAVTPLKTALTTYAEVHSAEGDAALEELQRPGGGPSALLAALLALAMFGLVASLWCARSVQVRLREAVGFAGHVADGDLAARLHPRGRDELSDLATSLNAMVDQLTMSSAQRDATLDDELAYRAAQDVFSEILQVTEDEQEAHDTLKLHIERGIAHSELVVLNRNNSEDRLEATTTLAADSRLLEPLKTAKPRSCLAVRLARPFHSDGPARSLVSCEICGATESETSCVPLLVSGEVIGSVLIDHAEPFGTADERLVHESVAYAAPILANLRNLSLAEARAATDALTGLPNRRAIQDTLKRMLAQSSRTNLPLAAVMLDLDHFKQINDAYGHDQGDAVLGAVGDVLSSATRASDFVGRSGGEEFIALLPDTDTEGAVTLTEKLRVAVAKIDLPGVNRPITASFGIAIYPDAATDSETLLRLADRALYLAKSNGRNRVELADEEAPNAAGPGFEPTMVAPAM